MRPTRFAGIQLEVCYSLAGLVACGGVSGTPAGGISVGGTFTGAGGFGGVGEGGPPGCGIGGLLPDMVVPVIG